MPHAHFITAAHHAQLLANGQQSARDPDHDPIPVVKLFTPDAGASWLLSEPNMAFGLCDLGVGCPELGSVSLSELADIRGRLGLPIERDRHFHPDKLISTYATAARAAGRIVA